MSRLVTAILLFIIVLVLVGISFKRCNRDDGSPRILIFNKTEFYFHESTAAGTEALIQLCKENHIQVDVTDEAENFTQEYLNRYAAIVFLNTAGDVLNYKQEELFHQYIQAGGGYVGIHTAIDTEHNWKWYGNLVGAHFDGQSEVQNAKLLIEDPDNPATQMLDTTWERKDEWFNLQKISTDVHILLSLDEGSYTGGTMGNFHPVSWYHDFDGGRAFVTAMGHTPESYNEPEFLQHLLGGIKYAMGDNKPLDYSKVHPDATAQSTSQGGTGFVKTSLVCDLYEPMELELLPDGKVLFIERRGAVKLFNPETKQLKVVDEIPVFIKNEEGLLGLTLDPHWEQNNWIYLFYTPEKENKAIRLSRFVFKNDSLYRGSEKIILTVPTLDDPHHYHAAGSIEFDDRGYLYIATGDNTSHRDGYSSLDERPGEQAFDSQKSSSNTMDLRGKILRIKPLPDGSYICPAGNLYVDKDILVAPGTLALLNDPLLQPVVEQALHTSAANLGLGSASNQDGASPASWQFPFSVRAAAGSGRPEVFVMGVRNPFRISFDNRRKTLFWGEPGPDAGFADPNFGPEGYDEINAARTAGNYGWPYVVGPNKPFRDYDHFTNTPGPYYDALYPVNNSLNNTGVKYLPYSRRPMIWYSFSSSPEFPLLANGTRCAMAGPTYYCDRYPAETRFPDQYDGKLIVYDWMRNWIMAVTLDSTGNYVSMDPLFDNLRVSKPTDMVIDKNGSLWMLEYGTEWYMQNPDACLTRIDFVRGTGKDTLPQQAAAPAGPPIHWDFGAKNRSFYQAGEVVPYRVLVSDANAADLSSVDLAIEYSETDQNPLALAQSYKPVKVKNEFERGQALVEGSDCKSCHAIDRQVNGPAFLAVSGRYSTDPSALTKLTKKIIYGGSGNWGERSMSAHPQLAPQDVGEIVKWILSLREQSQKALPMQGHYTMKPPIASNSKPGVYIFHASNAKLGGETLVLRPTLQQVEKADAFSAGIRNYVRPLNATTTQMTELKNGQYFAFKHIDLNGLKSIDLAVEVAVQKNQTGGGALELRIDKPDGPVVGSVPLPASSQANGPGLTELTLALNRKAGPGDPGFHDLYFVVNNGNAGDKAVVGVDWMEVGF